ncbi:tail assembly chaperone [Gordonia phage Dexdert]|uniref:Tail assembly chaperone n=1 Tax=Gordonia phage Dexdert TaxID=2794946 RepID=A0A7T1NXN1_9CAUD|nr:tail assembly chaperone [Gordonia phage Dexdert]QDF19612.1 tail assembly chaperone [Gordonia Terrae phage RoadKill]QPO17027.1 tail assembly chaperone [Gordonia phage Dexdert]
MALAPPWGDAPPGFVLDGAFLATRTPNTRELVRAMLMPEESNVGGLFITMSFCTADSWPRLGLAIMRPGSGVSLDLLQFVADRLVETHLGMPRWVAERLWQQAASSWMLVDGELQLRGLDVFEMPVDRATNAIYALIRSWQTGDKATLDRWVRKITTPPLREIERWKRDDVAVESAGADDMAARMAKMKRAQRESRPSPAGATITMPTSDTLRSDTNDQRELPSR